MRKFKMKSSKNYAEDSVEDTHKTNNEDVSLETVFLEDNNPNLNTKFKNERNSSNI
jgi:hypothetical protein